MAKGKNSKATWATRPLAHPFPETIRWHREAKRFHQFRNLVGGLDRIPSTRHDTNLPATASILRMVGSSPNSFHETETKSFKIWHLFGRTHQTGTRLSYKWNYNPVTSWWFFTNPFEKYANRQIGS